MPRVELEYEQLPGLVRDNLSARQWLEVQPDIIVEGQSVPETTVYVNLKNGQCRQYTIGEVAGGPLLPTHDLSGGRGKDSSQFHTEPPGVHD